MGANQNFSPEHGLCPKINSNPSLLTQPRPPSYRQAIGLRNRVRDHNGTMKWYWQGLSETDDKNQIKNRFISSQVFHRTPGGRVQKITAGEQFKPRILKSFDPVTQELYREHPATILTNS
jgi:hypothetical protein